MAAPAGNDSTDHLLITAHLYWLTTGDGEGSEGIQYTERQPRVHREYNETSVCAKRIRQRQKRKKKHTHKRTNKVKDNGKNDWRSSDCLVQLFEFRV